MQLILALATLLLAGAAAASGDEPASPDPAMSAAEIRLLHMEVEQLGQRTTRMLGAAFEHRDAPRPVGRSGTAPSANPLPAKRAPDAHAAADARASDCHVERERVLSCRVLAAPTRPRPGGS